MKFINVFILILFFNTLQGQSLTPIIAKKFIGLKTTRLLSNFKEFKSYEFSSGTIINTHRQLGEIEYAYEVYQNNKYFLIVFTKIIENLNNEEHINEIIDIIEVAKSKDEFHYGDLVCSKRVKNQEEYAVFFRPNKNGERYITQVWKMDLIKKKIISINPSITECEIYEPD